MKLIQLFFFLISFNCLSQINNGKIEYGLHISTFEGLEKTTRMKVAYVKAMENSPFINFELLFNSNESFFSIKDGLGLDDQGYLYAKLFSGYEGVIFQNEEFSYSEIKGEIGKFLIKRNKRKDWTLENETKEINGFVCFKATAVKTVINSAGVFHFPIIAWYCPQIPLSYGPNGYGGLPGLILELQVRNILFGVKKIDLKPNKNILVPQRKEFKVVSEKEYEDILLKK
ncbi:GLPGLI family protein [Flavobacterium sp. CG_9.1]|uniref:GLPGLI family protein n=1 Tax=Flavobacterium sp. CG_9.1 TaxID=2787728 RepID=UPI0018CB1734|nr:GLPGLI family protein [Flavobacterium sp. CG_9.1]MBG6060315.1 GLPGLI family protein [Flavobacterium sp. CG_9.1]